MVDEKTGYAVLQQVAVPVDMLEMLAQRAFSLDYEYVDGDYEYRPKNSIESVKLVHGKQLIANQIAYRLRKDSKK